MKIAIFLGGNFGGPECYQNNVSTCARLLAQHDVHAYYGGGHIGLMGVFADTYLEHHGKISGVMPQSLIDQEQAHRGLTEFVVVNSMTERKQKLLEIADAFLVLPGGAGTIDEFFMVWTEKKIGTHNKPIAILNTNNLYQPLLTQLQNLSDDGFIPKTALELFLMTDDIGAVVEHLLQKS